MFQQACRMFCTVRVTVVNFGLMFSTQSVEQITAVYNICTIFTVCLSVLLT
jgi:hypothetical protein